MLTAAVETFTRPKSIPVLGQLHQDLGELPAAAGVGPLAILTLSTLTPGRSSRILYFLRSVRFPRLCV